MRKLSLIFMAVLVAALAGCAGDTTGEGGSLTTVIDFQLDATSAGRTIVLTWSAISDDIDGYEVYFKADGTGDWAEVGESTTTTYTHTATNAGTYSVRAYKGTDFSKEFSTTATTMPNIVSGTYTIYDNFSAASTFSGFIFGATAGTEGSAASTDFFQDMYAYDESKGDTDVWLYSGNFGAFSNGNQCHFQQPLGNGYADPAGRWSSTAYKLLTSDSVVFVELPYKTGPSAYAKVYALSITADATDNGTKVTFMYEYQPNTLGLSVFTSNAN